MGKNRTASVRREPHAPHQHDARDPAATACTRTRVHAMDEPVGADTTSELSVSSPANGSSVWFSQVVEYVRGCDLADAREAFGNLAALLHDLTSVNDDEAASSATTPSTAWWFWLPSSITGFARQKRDRPYLRLTSEVVGNGTVYPRTRNPFQDSVGFPRSVWHRRHQHPSMRTCGLTDDADVLACHPIAIPGYHFRARTPACVEDDARWLASFCSALDDLESGGST